MGEKEKEKRELREGKERREEESGEKKGIISLRGGGSSVSCETHGQPYIQHRERRGGTLQKDKKYFYNFISNISFRVRLKIIFILK